MATPSVIQQALARREKVVQKLERSPIYRELVQLDQFIEIYRRFDSGAAAAAKSPSEPAKKTIVSMSAHICAERGEPVPLRVLLDSLRSQGRPVGGENPAINLSSILSRDPQFENVAGRGWQLAITKEKPDEESSEPLPFSPTGDGG